MKHMIHGPCGPNINPSSPCMQNGQCGKRFPKPFCDQTHTGNDSYPQYKRRHPDQEEHTGQKFVSGQEFTVDNRWVVPYNPFLLQQFDCHLNVEICASIKAIKYVLKYIHKGSDQAIFIIERDSTMYRDEIQRFQHAQYIGSIEACWRIFEFKL